MTAPRINAHGRPRGRRRRRRSARVVRKACASALSAVELRRGTIRERELEMGKIVVSENVTLDGVVEDPAGAEAFSRGGWVGRVGERGREEAAKVLLDGALGAEAQLFGRRTCEFLAARWLARSGAPTVRMNDRAESVA